MSLFRSTRSSTLRVDLGERQVALRPGDKLSLTHEATVDAPGIKSVARVTATYQWDGRVFKRVWE